MILIKCIYMQKIQYEAKYHYLIIKGKRVGLDHFHDSKAFKEYSNYMQDIYKLIEEYNPSKKGKY